MEDFKERILKAARYIENGDPYSDVLDREDIIKCIEELSKVYKKEERLFDEMPEKNDRYNWEEIK